MKLTEICQIEKLEPIDGADLIERATVKGWSCVVKKGFHKEKDFIIFIYPDTLIPKKFVDSSYEGDEKIRLKTIKLKGTYSAGLIVPLTELPKDFTFQEGDDVAEHFGIEKYEKPIPLNLRGEIKGNFPSIISKTDEDNYRSNPKAVKELIDSGEEVFATLKMDGTSSTFILTEGEFKVCSRNLELKENDTNIYWNIAKEYKIKEILEKHFQETGQELGIQGEICGPTINGGNTGVKKATLFVFLIKDVKKRLWLNWDEIKEFCKKYDLPHVKELFRKNSKDLNFKEIQIDTDQLRYPNEKLAEGIVIRTVKPYISNELKKSWISLKIISQPYDQKNS
jgi:RNA ligase (TIGR02306 family)